MTKVTTRYAEDRERPIFLCDFSPPRGGDRDSLDQVKHLDGDFLCVAYNPGKSVRADSAITAYALQQYLGKEVIFNLACRDMNKLALQSHLLGALLLGLENVIIVQGDPFTGKELALVKEVGDFKPTELIASVQAMNQGLDYRGMKLRAATDFCIGAIIDPGREMEREVSLVRRKASAGVQFFITQAIYEAEQVPKFLGLYHSLYDHELTQPVFCGVQILAKEGVIFGDAPPEIQQDLDKGRPGIDIAVEMLHALMDQGIRTFYLIPPILKGGLRDYGAAQQVLSQVKT